MVGSHSDGPLHQLWPPPEDNRSTKCDVLFFHGLQFTADYTVDAWRSTWTQRGNENVCWPEEWLPFDLGGALRIISVSYNVHVVTSPHDHVSEIAHNLFQTLITNRRYEWQHPIVLIGHSFGGLVLKSLVVKLVKASAIQNPTNPLSEITVQRAKAFLRNVRGVAFYAVPHSGSNIAENVNKLVRYCNQNLTSSWWQALVEMMRWNVRYHPFTSSWWQALVELLRWNVRYHPLIDNIRPWKRDMEELSKDFGDIATENKINVFAFCEGIRMEQVGILVEVSSAQRLAGDNFYKVEDANHIEVCKPRNQQDMSYSLLLQFILSCQQVPREYDQPLQEVYDLPQAIFGMDSYVERVESLVTSEQSDAEPQYVAVRGMGGVGKTLLLQILYGSQKVHDHFRAVPKTPESQLPKFIWCTVTQRPDMMALYRTFSAELGLQPEETAIPEYYKHKLFNHFKQRRVFLVLDDVWTVEAFNSLDLARGKGSVTLLSTRNHSLLDKISRQVMQQEMTPLSKEDSWSLFCEHAFKPPSNVPRELEALAQCVAEECQGLPLALKVIGGAMRGKVNRKYEWEPLLKVCMTPMHDKSVEEQLYERLKIGYDLLSEDDCRLKECFQYFAAFPEDSTIIFEEILFHWTAQKLVSVDDEDDSAADAFSLLKKLWERSFIESNGQFNSDKCYTLNFKVHDVMRDLALYILEKDCGTPPAKEVYFYRAGQNLGEVPKQWKTLLEARTISLDTNKLERLPESFRAPNLVSLLLGGNPIISLSANFSSNFPMLSVLNLRDGQFHSLPEELGDLKNLVCLDLSNCHDLEILPDTVRKLRELKFLILDDCWNLKYLPSGVVDLTSLQVLHTAHCGNLTWAEHTLSRTAGATFGYSGAALGYSTIGASLEDICQLLLLTELTIFAEDAHAALDILELPQNELPHNISSLTKLQLLQVWVDIKTLPADMSCRCIQLQELELCSWMLKYLPNSFTRCGAFPALITLKLSCYELVEFPEVDQGALPKLRTINFNGCHSLETLPLSLEILPNFSSLIVDDCTNILQNSCRANCQKSAIWSNWNINYGYTNRYRPLPSLDTKITRRLGQIPSLEATRYTFNCSSNQSLQTVGMHLQWKTNYYNRRRNDDENILNP